MESTFLCIYEVYVGLRMSYMFSKSSIFKEVDLPEFCTVVALAVLVLYFAR